jgi:hypothetical protein
MEALQNNMLPGDVIFFQIVPLFEEIWSTFRPVRGRGLTRKLNMIYPSL